jgi:hypothetical protein
MTDSEEESAQPDSLDESQLRLLRAWRTERIDSMSEHRRGEISVAIFNQIRARRTPVPNDLRFRAQSGDGLAWVRIADFVGTGRDFFETDREASCLLIATCHGSRWAAMVLTLRLAAVEADGIDPEIRSANLRILTARFYLHGVTPGAVVLSLGVKREVLNALSDETPPTEKEPEKPPPQPAKGPPPAEPTGPAIQVLLQKPVPSTDRSLNAVLTAFEQIHGHVRLITSPDPRELTQQLHAEFPWTPLVTDEIEMQLALDRRLGNETFRLPPTIMVGPSGSGKSRFARRLGVLSNLPVTTLLAAGATDSRTLSGTPRGWGTSTPSLPLETIRRARIANPLIVVEEIDKAGGSGRNGRLTDMLLAMLDPALSTRWLDESLQVEADISRISWVLTANRLDRIPPALRARCRVIPFPPPRARDFDVLFAGILKDLAESYWIDVDALPSLTNELVERLRAGFTSGRLTARQLSQLVRRTLALQTVADSITPFH